MSDGLKRMMRFALGAVAVAIIVAGLWPTDRAPLSAEERTEQVAAVIRCPFCNGESIGEATSQVARDLELIIAEQVAAGRSDDEIFSYFSDRYGESILMAPPLRGWGWGLWALPLLALAVGGFVIWRKRRSGAAAGGVQRADDELEAARLWAAIEQIERDIEESEHQYEIGEIDEATLTDLTATYEAERTDRRQALAVAEPGDAEGESDPGGNALRPSLRRLVGAALLVVGAVAITVFAVSSADRSDADATAGVVDAPPIDLANVTVEQLEEVVAANPRIIGMRLALAQLLLAEDDVQRAVFHFGEVLELERHPEALAWLGFISYQIGETETAQNYLEEALERQPNYPQAQWWLANVRFVGLGDAAGAIGPLEALLAFDGVPEDIRGAAEALLQQAKAAA